jgi:hypothetical protein
MSTTEIVTNTLDKLASEINKEAKLAEQHAMQAVNHALNAGRLLTEAKEQCPHGQWLPWMAENFEGSARTAQGYMRLFEHRDVLANTQRAAHLSVREALKMLAEPQAVAPEEKPEPYKPPSRDAIERWPDLLDGPSRVFHAEGMSHAQIAELFGVDEDLVKKRMNPEAPHRECGDWADAGLATLYTKRVQNYIYHHQANAYLCAAAFAHKVNPKLADGFLALEKHYQEKSRSGVQSIYAMFSDAGELQSSEAEKESFQVFGIQLEAAAHHDYLEAVGIVEPTKWKNFVGIAISILPSEEVRKMLRELQPWDMLKKQVNLTALEVKPDPEKLVTTVKASKVLSHYIEHNRAEK